MVLPFVEEWFVCYFVRNGNKDAAKIRDGIEGAVERECGMRKNRLLMKVSWILEKHSRHESLFLFLFNNIPRIISRNWILSVQRISKEEKNIKEQTGVINPSVIRDIAYHENKYIVRCVYYIFEYHAFKMSR